MTHYVVWLKVISSTGVSDPQMTSWYIRWLLAVHCFVLSTTCHSETWCPLHTEFDVSHQNIIIKICLLVCFAQQRSNTLVILPFHCTSFFAHYASINTLVFHSLFRITFSFGEIYQICIPGALDSLQCFLAIIFVVSWARNGEDGVIMIFV